MYVLQKEIIYYMMINYLNMMDISNCLKTASLFHVINERELNKLKYDECISKGIKCSFKNNNIEAVKYFVDKYIGKNRKLIFRIIEWSIKNKKYDIINYISGKLDGYDIMILGRKKNVSFLMYNIFLQKYRGGKIYYDISHYIPLHKQILLVWYDIYNFSYWNTYDYLMEIKKYDILLLSIIFKTKNIYKPIILLNTIEALLADSIIDIIIKYKKISFVISLILNFFGFTLLTFMIISVIFLHRYNYHLINFGLVMFIISFHYHFYMFAYCHNLIFLSSMRLIAGPIIIYVFPSYGIPLFQ